MRSLRNGALRPPGMTRQAYQQNLLAQPLRTVPLPSEAQHLPTMMAQITSGVFRNCKLDIRDMYRNGTETVPYS